jgi:hypothetical protein
MNTVNVRLDYPLDRVPEPVFTHLVKGFDVAPNVLAASIDAHKGGWILLGLTGSQDQIDLALSWVRERGIVVTKE